MRVLKEEVMASEEEAIAYDLVVSRYVDIVHAGFAETVINLSPPEGRFLEIGTGTGWDSVLVAKNTSNVKVTAIDLSDEMLKFASRNASREGVDTKIHFMKADAKGLPFEDRSFDAVYSQNMLHHLPEPKKMLAGIKRVVKSDGAIIIRDLGRYSSFINALCVNILGMNYNTTMKEEYRKSILAAFSRREWFDLKNTLNMPEMRLTRQFFTHMSIERPSARRRRDSYVKVVNPIYRRIAASFYISRP
ncbi:MAG: class I SAM-dependent methyltransferase [Candidatus Omnitrophica bacterium]|nr:class I SAM-dependent methyltransferase [Candidatus Omnitrophota bacterium]